MSTNSSPDLILAALSRALDHAGTHLASLERGPVAATASTEELRARLGGPLPREGQPAPDVVDALAAATAGGLLRCGSGRFFGWVIGGSLGSALGADWLTSTWDQNAAIGATSPAAAVAEEVAGRWLLEALALPAESSFAFTTGCQLAHFTCLAAARHQVLSAHGHDVGADGLFGAPPVRVLVSAERHASVDRALRFLGFGARQLVVVPVDARGQLDVVAFRVELSHVAGPTIVVLDAADLNIGAFDAFSELIPLAHAAGAWVHVDGAFGVMARLSPKRRAQMPGLELADSWATDAHKWLNVPFDCGFAVVRHAAAHRAAMSVSASYITPQKDGRDQLDYTPDWSRRARGFPVWAALRELGTEGLAALVERCCAHATHLFDGLAALPGVEGVWRPTLNQGLVRFLEPATGAGPAEHDARTDAVIAKLNAGGEAFFSGTTWRGRRAMRLSVVNWRTSSNDVERAIEAARRTLAER